MESEHTCTLALVILLLAAHRHVYYINPQRIYNETFCYLPGIVNRTFEN